jgi:hypothetical protein
MKDLTTFLTESSITGRADIFWEWCDKNGLLPGAMLKYKGRGKTVYELRMVDNDGEMDRLWAMGDGAEQWIRVPEPSGKLGRSVAYVKCTGVGFFGLDPDMRISDGRTLREWYDDTVRKYNPVRNANRFLCDYVVDMAYTGVEDKSYVSGWDIKPYIGDAKAIYKSFMRDMK